MLPQVKIIEQPATRGTRYRYECEMRSQGIIQGASGPGNYPTIQILNYIGDLTIIICCVTNDPPFRPHPHKLVNGNLEHKHGVCYFRFPSYNGQPIPFKNLSIQCVARKFVKQALLDREQQRIDPFKTGFQHKNRPDDIDLNCVRLCIQVVLECTLNPILLNPVVTNSIYDRRTVCDLKICWLSHKSAPITGGMEMCILCDKVRKTDVEVRFIHEKSNWEARAILVSPKILKQVAIVFQIPPFKIDNHSLGDVQEPIDVKIQLVRKSNGETSQPESFRYLPLTNGNLELAAGYNSSKRKRNHYYENNSSELYRKIQAEVIAERSKTFVGQREFQESQIGEKNEIEPWELPAVNKFPSSHSKSSILPLVNKNRSILKNLSIRDYQSNNIQSQDKILTTQTNIIKKQENNNEAGILNSDTWVEVLLKSLDPKGTVAFPNSQILANEIANELQTDFLVSNLNTFDHNGSNSKINNTCYVNGERNLSYYNHRNYAPELTYECLYNNISTSDLIKDININIEDSNVHINDDLIISKNLCNTTTATINDLSYGLNHSYNFR